MGGANQMEGMTGFGDLYDYTCDLGFAIIGLWVWFVCHSNVMYWCLLDDMSL